MPQLVTSTTPADIALEKLVSEALGNGTSPDKKHFPASVLEKVSSRARLDGFLTDYIVPAANKQPGAPYCVRVLSTPDARYMQQFVKFSAQYLFGFVVTPTARGTAPFEAVYVVVLINGLIRHLCVMA